MMEACGEILPFFVCGGLGRSNMVNLRSPCLGSTGASERWFPPAEEDQPFSGTKETLSGKEHQKNLK